jgi:hypothetical protein
VSSRFLSLVVVIVLLVGVAQVGAQGSISTPPSLSGGKTGSPGMGGAASMPSFDVPHPPTFNPPSAQPPTFNPSSLSGSLPSFTPPSGAQGQRERPGGGQIQRPGGGQQTGGEAVQQWGSSFSPFSQDAAGQWSRFGTRGSSNIPLPELSPEGLLGWYDSGGFGAVAEPPAGVNPGNSQNLAQDWRPDGAPDGIPAAPAAFGDLQGVTQAQTNAQDAIQNAGTNRDEISATAQQNIQTATQYAQQTYDQFWQDYYAAVDYTAQAYYDTVTASADYVLQTYDAALEYTLAAVDYYLAYYDQYAAYCYVYPWDCYMYAYDVASGAYYYVGDVSSAPVASVEIGDVTVTTSYPPASTTPVPSAEAYKAVTVFANDQLGAVVEPLYAGETTDQVQVMIQALPPEMQAFMLSALGASCADYWALLNGGVAGVLAGDCRTGDHSISLAGMNAELSSASLGAYVLYAEASVPATPSDALSLITTVYPALKGLAFAQVTDIEQGMAFTATAAGLGTDPVTGASLSVPKVIYAGVINANGVPLVYALAGVGQPYVDMIATGQGVR